MEKNVDSSTSALSPPTVSVKSGMLAVIAGQDVTVTVNLSEAEQVASSSPLMALTMMLPECPSFRGTMVSTLPVRLSDTAFCVESAKEIAKVSPGSMFIKWSETLILTGLPPTTIFRSDRRSSSFTIGQGVAGSSTVTVKSCMTLSHPDLLTVTVTVAVPALVPGETSSDVPVRLAVATDVADDDTV